MKIKRVTTEQAELTNTETEILSKVKSYCNSQPSCSDCIFNMDNQSCHMSKMWTKLGKLNVKYGDIK